MSPNNREVLLEVKNLKKYFPVYEGVFSRKNGDVKAVDDITFNVKKGEITGLVGESGCGKSTAGKTILNLLEPTGGSVRFNNEDIFNGEKNYRIPEKQMRRLRKEMQIIFQDPFSSLNPRMNIGTILTEGLLKHKVYGKKEGLEKVGEILNLCGLDKEALYKYPHEFSGGQRQRIGIARAIALEPQLIVGDEIIAALDVSIQSQIITLLQNMIEQFNLTTIFISHDLSVVKYFCDSVYVMYLGCFAETGSSEQLFSYPVHPYTRALLSAVPKLSPGENKNRIILEGEVPTVLNPPSGCRFHTRCPYAAQRCREVLPPFIEVEKGHFVSCHLAEKIYDFQI